jgi:phosphohistidine swiveling domain-containing protein
VIIATLNDDKQTVNRDSLITIDLQAGKVKSHKKKE